MRRTLSYALIVACASANAQVDPQWMAKRFGIAVMPHAPNAGNTMTDYVETAFRESNPSLNAHNTPLVMNGKQVVAGTKKRAFNDKTCSSWNEILDLTDKLPANTWVRVDTNLADHYYGPGQVNPEKIGRITEGIVSRMLLRSTDMRNNLNVLFVTAPGVHAHSGTWDLWTKITVNPKGAPLSKPLETGLPRNRDWWRPQPVFRPYIRESMQKMIYQINDTLATESKRKYGAGFNNFNYLSRVAFQLGNEPGGGHPGGSVFSKVGSWDGIGEVNEAIFGGLNYGVSPNVQANLGVPTTFGKNSTVLPAFSFLGHGGSIIGENKVGGRLKNFTHSGVLSAATNEISSAMRELNGRSWAASTSRRSLHFRSPALRWKFRFNDFAETNNGMYGTLFHGPGDPNWGGWETPEEYAKRWVSELEEAVDAVGNLPLGTAATTVDVTETYFPTAELGCAPFDANMTMSTGAKVSFQNMTLEQVREMGRTHRFQNGVWSPLKGGQVPPSRQQLMVAIRNELFQRDVVQKNLHRNLGRIFLWSSMSFNQRFETGLNTNASGDVVGYNPWIDMRLSPAELRAFWNIQ